jgi:hypothetical protein
MTAPPDTEDHYGHCRRDQYEWFAQQLARYEEQGWLRIGSAGPAPGLGVRLVLANLRFRTLARLRQGGYVESYCRACW